MPVPEVKNNSISPPLTRTEMHIAPSISSKLINDLPYAGYEGNEELLSPQKVLNHMRSIDSIISNVNAIIACNNHFFGDLKPLVANKLPVKLKTTTIFFGGD